MHTKPKHQVSQM